MIHLAKNRIAKVKIGTVYANNCRVPGRGIDKIVCENGILVIAHFLFSDLRTVHDNNGLAHHVFKYVRAE